MLHAVIMAGGSGTRFWPKSRRDSPKQLLRLFGERTMIQQTVARIAPLVPPERTLVVTGADQVAATRAQLPELPRENLVAEPCPRDTAPCVGLAAWIVARRDPEGTMVVMPADHVIEPAEAFHQAVAAAASVIDDYPSTLVTFGIQPTRPEVGYGYIERGSRLETRNGIPVYQVVQFREKPDRETAERFLAAGRFVWNSGIFLWKARTILEELREHRPGLAERLNRIGAALGTEAAFDTLREEYEAMERVPIDRAVLEKARDVRVMEAPYQWNDVGDWRALASLLPRDAAQNATQGDVVARETTNSIIVSDDGGLIATLGLEDLVVIQSGKATLVASKDKLDQLKALVESLGNEGFGAYL
jgi:mannose-1-phosphate guanylyltransferase